MTLVRIDAPHFVAGCIVEDGRVVRAAPITLPDVFRYANRHRWRIEMVSQVASTAAAGFERKSLPRPP